MFLFSDDTLSSDKSTLDTVRGSIVQGFRWGCREGPLCDEPMRSCKFKVVDVTLAAEAIYRGGGQIIPASRRAIYSSFLVAEPRLLEPIYHVEIFTPEDCMEPCKKVLSRRRGHITSTAPKPGTSTDSMHWWCLLGQCTDDGCLCFDVFSGFPCVFPQVHHTMSCMVMFQAWIVLVLKLI